MKSRDRGVGTDLWIDDTAHVIQAVLDQGREAGQSRAGHVRFGRFSWFVVLLRNAPGGQLKLSSEFRLLLGYG